MARILADWFATDVCRSMKIRTIFNNLSKKIMIFSQICLWDFSLALYRVPAVERICLQLQDEAQAKVNILLWCRWLETRSIRLTTARLTQALQRINSWDESVVEPLRQLRRTIRQTYGVDDESVEACRQRIKTAELAAEKVELEWLECLADEWTVDPAPPCQGENLQLYLRSINVSDDLMAAALAQLTQRLDSK